MVVICPRRTREVVEQEVARFREDILLPEFAERVKFVEYEQYIAVLEDNHGEDAHELAQFLQGRIRTVATGAANVPDRGQTAPE